MITEISRAEALAAFAERHPTLAPDELEDVFSQWLAADALDFRRDESGKWRVVLRGPRRKH